MTHESYILANWDAPKSIRALTTTRCNGYSIGPYAACNLGLHVDDQASHVYANREQLKSKLHLSKEPAWLQQTHSTEVTIVEEDENRHADASITRLYNTPLVILTADCLPIVICNIEGNEVAAIHAGWRGLYGGIIQNTLEKMYASPAALIAWIGPAICQSCYETSAEVKAQFTKKYPYLEHTFLNRHANLAKMAELILNHNGVTRVFQSNICTFEEKNRCYSYRRAPQTGRMGTFIWFQ